MADIFKPREVFKPFEYPEAFTFWEHQQSVHWLPSEVSMSGDIIDWNQNLNEKEKHLIGSILKSFTQVEILVNDYWSTSVSKWFPKPEIAMMASTFGSMETIHTVAYSYLNDSLGITDYSLFLEDEAALAKIKRLKAVKKGDKASIARSLAIFSAFTEGVSLYSSFAILMNFSRFDKLKGVSNIVSWSVGDEAMHSRAGIWLYSKIIEENTQILTDDFKKDIYEAARVTVKLEDDFIDKAFELGDVEGLTAYDLKQFIRERANSKLIELGLKSNWKNIDKEAANRVSSWFYPMTSGTEFADFFRHRVTSYSKGVVDFSKIFD